MSGTSDSPVPEHAADAPVVEVQGHFPNDQTLQAALESLEAAGYDRTDFSLPEDQHADVTGTRSDEQDGTATDSADKAQLRTLGTGMAGYLGAVGVAGATIATGGAAGVAIAAAAAVGAGGALAAEAIGKAAEQSQTAARDQRGAAGKLILAVRTTTPAQADQVTQIFRDAGATDAVPVSGKDQALTTGYSAASWTGG